MTQERPWAILDAFRGKDFTGEWPTIPELFGITVSRFPERNCFTVFEPDRITLTYRQADEKIRKVSRFLRSIGVKKGQKVALTGKNSPEWAVAYLAALYADAVIVPIDAMLKVEECKNLLKASDAVVLFADEEKFDAIDEKDFGLLGKYSLVPQKGTYLFELDANETVLPSGYERNKETDLAAILFTSGTTGTPKGVMLSHSNLVSDCFLAQCNIVLYETDVFYALLPLHHSYTMLAVFIETIATGAELVFGKRMATKAILKELREANVTMFLGVPLLFNKVLAGILKGIKEKGPVVHGLLSFLMFVSGLVKKSLRVNPGKKIFHTVLEKASLASNRICISGGGPLAPSVFRTYNQLGIDFIQGYGLTETSPILALNPVERYKVDSVGQILPRIDVKILNPDERGIGEIIVKGPMVMQGYYKMPEETKAVFTEDGYFKTGDLGKLDAENYLYLAGRAKNLIVTEGGKNVYPEEIENLFQLYPEVDQVLIRGYIMDKKLLSEGIEAVIHPSEEFFRDTFAKDNLPYVWSDVEEHIQTILDEVNSKLLPYQRIGKLTLVEEPLEMTTTKKIKRVAK